MAKDFKKKIDPVMAFIDQEKAAAPGEQFGGQIDIAAPEAPEGFKVDPRFVETKSKRVQLLIQPSLFLKAKAAATKEGISLNEYVHRAIESKTKGE